ncbi:hypothetical protein [Haloprofundus salilacus]|uniref:hypothetical protein n=1 Tax=Haloprofundus salilacus TaxID=2876190 RepID=UPI001CC9EA7E|nr:hypothetical protein [Haloprofundus salilacus]
MGLFGSPSDADGRMSGGFESVEEEREEQWWVPANPRDDQFNGTLKRVVDEEAGIVIYAYTNGNAGGVTAVPLSRTTLDIGTDEGESSDASS